MRNITLLIAAFGTIPLVLSQGLDHHHHEDIGGVLGHGHGRERHGIIGLSRGVEIHHHHHGEDGGSGGGGGGGGGGSSGGGGGGGGGSGGGGGGGGGDHHDGEEHHHHSIGFTGSKFHTPVDVHHEEEVHLKAHPEYKYDYKVADHKHKDYHSKQEHRDGYKVTGSYSLLEPDHKTIRIVDYTSDKKQGFIAKVHYKHHE